MPESLTRDDLAAKYLEQLPYAPYPLQEEALLTWYTSEEGILVCAPTGTGKTLIAEAALFEALHMGKIAYYTTPLIALTEQKFREMQDAAERWGFSRDDVGLITGNRKVNPDAKILVVVAEILLNRLLHPEAFNDLKDVFAVVMDEFHSFNDPERGAVWELSLTMLPRHIRLMLLSATVGNTAEFMIWLRGKHGRKVDLVQGTERKVPLHFEWVGTKLLNEQLESMNQEDDELRRTPALLFCFNRYECWNVAEQLKGKDMLASGQQKKLVEAMEGWDWSSGVGPKLKPILLRGVGVHHAGLLPKYRRRVEELFQKKLLSVCVCTETLAAGINLPARSVVLTSLIKGPPGKKIVIDSSSAHQIFGRAGRPQFDTRGFVYALAHEDDVKIIHWKEKYDQIPEDTKDPMLIRAKKAMKKKMPTRRTTEQYWNEQQFQKLILAPPAKLASRGQLPWRLLSYLLALSPDVERIRTFVKKRMLDSAAIERAEIRLNEMLVTLWSGGYVTLDPEPPEEYRRPKPVPVIPAVDDEPPVEPAPREGEAPAEPRSQPVDEFGGGLEEETPSDEVLDDDGSPDEMLSTPTPDLKSEISDSKSQPSLALTFGKAPPPPPPPQKKAKVINLTGKPIEPAKLPPYAPKTAAPTAEMSKLLAFRSINPIYGAWLLEQMAAAEPVERLQLLESVLEVPSSLLSQVRVPPPEVLPPGPLAREKIDPELIARGLLTPADINPNAVEEDANDRFNRERKFAVPLAEKAKLLFESDFPGVLETPIRGVWIAGDLDHFGWDFDKYVRGRDLTKQEGLIFRHLLRLILLCDEFSSLCPPGMNDGEWRDSLRDLSERLTEACRKVDPDSTDETLAAKAAADVTAS
jgi:superfamily II DNA/RNA helicase